MAKNELLNNSPIKDLIRDIREHASEIDRDLDPNSPSMKAVRLNSELRDRKLAEKGTIVRLPASPDMLHGVI